MNKPVYSPTIRRLLPGTEQVNQIFNDFEGDYKFEPVSPYLPERGTDAFKINRRAGSRLRLRQYLGPLEKKNEGKVDGIIVEMFHPKPNIRAQSLYADLSRQSMHHHALTYSQKNASFCPDISAELAESTLKNLDTSINALLAELSLTKGNPCEHAPNAAGFLELLLSSRGFLSEHDALFVEAAGIGQTAKLKTLRPYDLESIEYSVDGQIGHAIASHPLLHHLAPALTKHARHESELDHASVYALSFSDPRFSELFSKASHPEFILDDQERSELKQRMINRSYELLETARQLLDKGYHNRYCIAAGKLDVHAWTCPDQGSTYFENIFGDDAVMVFSPSPIPKEFKNKK